MSGIDNYEYCAGKAAELAPQGGVVLDYGCGAGQVVAKLRRRGVEAYGCETFFEGGDYSRQVPEGMLGDTIRRMQDGRIPFADASFDLVVNNQVMEHVEDLDQVLAEIDRVLKPGGLVLSVFPDLSIWREGHTGVPFLHRFPPGRLRHAYAAAWLSLGLGYRFGRKPLDAARSHGDYLDHWTHYRRYGDIRTSYGRHFSDFRHVEADWFSRRLGKDHLAVKLLPDFAKRYLTWKLAGMAFIVTKPGSADEEKANARA
jgi:SAM-dependent methyltransferase